MAYSETIAQTLRQLLAGQSGLTEKKMFGGVGFMLHGNMCCGVSGNDFMLRLSPAASDEALRQPYMRAFDMTGKPMKGWVLMSGDVGEDAELVQAWVQRAIAWTLTLPPK